MRDPFFLYLDNPGRPRREIAARGNECGRARCRPETIRARMDGPRTARLFFRFRVALWSFCVYVMEAATLPRNRKAPPLNVLHSVESVRELLRVCVNPSPLFGVVALPLRSPSYGPDDTADAGVYVDARDVSRLLLQVVPAKDLPTWAANALGTLFSFDVPTLPAFGLLDTACPCYVILQFTTGATDPKAGD